MALLLFQSIIQAVCNRLPPEGATCVDSFAMRLVHPDSGDVNWLHRNLTLLEIKERYTVLHPFEECRYNLNCFIIIKPIQYQSITA